MDTPVTGAATPTPKVLAIRALTTAGFTLIPLRGKVPTLKAWGNVAPGAYGEEQLADKNYGVKLGPSDLIIDVDPRNFRKGDPQALTRLCASVPGLDAIIQASFVVRTGGGGLHIYLSKPADFKIRQGLEDYPGIEFKTAGRQVVGPGSIHPDTQKTYEIVKNSPAAIQAAPQNFLELLAAPTAPSADAGLGTDGYMDDAATRTQYEVYLLTAPAATEGKGGDNETFRVACHGHDIGLPPKTTWELMLSSWNSRCAPPWSPEDLKVKVINAYKFASGTLGAKHPSAAGFEKLEKAAAPDPVDEGKDNDDIAWNMSGGRVTKSLFNLMNYLKWKQGGLYNIFGYNQFTGQVEFTAAAPWHRGRVRQGASAMVQDDDLKLLRAFLCDKHDFEASISDIENAVTAVAYRNTFHPVREYLEGIKWDGVSRLDTWLAKYCGADDTEYTRACARKTLCAAVTRVFKPGVKFDCVLVLEGAQGIGKSSVVKILGGEWYGDFMIDPHSPDTIQRMQGKWICEIAELAFRSQVEENAVKAFISRSSDKARLAYGRYATEFQRQSIFIGSINPSSDNTFLKDETGGRRWWPVACRPHGGKVDFKGLKDARDQLFAEALERVKTVGEALHMETLELDTAQRDMAASRKVEHPWTDKIASWLAGRADNPIFLTAMDVWTDCLGGSPKEMDRRKQVVIASSMRTCGWEPDVQRVDNHPTRGYAPTWLMEKRRSGAKDLPAPVEKRENKKELATFESLY